MIYSVFFVLDYGSSSIQTVKPGLKTEETDNEFKAFQNCSKKIAGTMKRGENHYLLCVFGWVLCWVIFL